MAVIGTSNINVQDIGSVLNEAGGSVNINQPLTFFTESAKINKWAKYKPVDVDNDFFELNDTIGIVNPITASYQTVPWYCGKVNAVSSGSNLILYTMYGMYVPVVSSTSDLTIVNAIKELETNYGMDWWQTVGISSGSPKRLGDFRKYFTEAVPGIDYYVTPTVYLGSDEQAFAGVTPSGENMEYQLSMSDIGDILGNSFEYGVLITTRSYGVVKYIDFGIGIDDVAGGQFSFSLSSGNYYAFLVAKSTSLEKTLILPSTPAMPNKFTIDVTTDINPAYNPFNKLSYSLYSETGCGFGYSFATTFFEPLVYAIEQDWVSLCTTGQFCFYIDFYAIETTTLNFADIHFEWLWTGSQPEEGIPQYRPIIAGASYANTRYTFQAGTTTRVYFQFDDIFYDSVKMTRYEPTYEETFYMDQMAMYYNTESLEGIDMNITYDQYHNGYFTDNAGNYWELR